MDYLIKADNVSLRVPMLIPADRQLLSNPLRFISDLYLGRSSRGVSDLLQGVSLTLKPGQRIGLIGQNGAGKSTLLKLLAGIYAPTTGSLEVNGVVKGLFDISLGMNPEATGLENIYIRGLQMGLSLGEMRDRVPQILEFSELQTVIEKPLNTFSTGMRLRLAVALSTMVIPEILLLDEWIGTGDLGFRDKVRAKMLSVVDGAKGMMLATHNVELMKSLCDECLVIHQGSVVFAGDLDIGLKFYEEEIHERASAKSLLCEAEQS